MSGGFFIHAAVKFLWQCLVFPIWMVLPLRLEDRLFYISPDGKACNSGTDLEDPVPEME
jgi:hypothetical protein